MRERERDLLGLIVMIISILALVPVIQMTSALVPTEHENLQ